MHFNFIEIGANDRGNLTHRFSGPGLVFEPIPMYFHNIPRSHHYIRKNVAVSDSNGRAEMRYYDRAKLSKDEKNMFLAGCGTLTDVPRKRWKHIEEVVEVEIWDVRRVINEFDISSVYYFKIDAEGMDSKIALRLFDWAGCPEIEYIQFETNSLTPSEEVNQVRVLLESKGYSRVSEGDNEHDSVYRLSVRLIK